MNQNILSGIQPTGPLHIGNYLGMVINAIRLQADYQCYYAVVDMHSLTGDYKAEEKQKQILDLVIELIALGIDPEKSVLFVQSHVPEHAELAWYFNTLVPMTLLERMTQYKDKASRQKTNINLGLFAYPVLQAADILLYKPYGVPIGADQVQHLELTNDIVKKFNHKFGKTFTEIKPLLTQSPRVMSLLSPDKKMSKSLGDAHVINLNDEPEVIQKKLSRAVTDTGKEKTLSAGSANLLSLFREFGAMEQYDFYMEQHKTGTIHYADVKKNLAKIISHYFADFRARRRELKANPDQIMQIIHSGQKKAQVVASQTLSEVKQKMGLIL